VETLIAISIFSMTIITMMSVLGGGISNTTHAKNKTIAGYLAQEGIEYVRNMRDSYVLSEGEQGWTKFKQELKSKCDKTPNKECGIDNNSASVLDANFIFKCNQHKDCNLYIDNGGYSNSGPSDSSFNRVIQTEEIGNELKIYSTVSWISGNTTPNPSITLTQNLFNWIE
jgi:Tfp pilus assembly protein PilV